MYRMRTLVRPLGSSATSRWLDAFVHWFRTVWAKSSFVGVCARIAFLFLASTAAVHVLLLEKSGELMGFGTLIDVDAEANLPTWFASFLAQAAAVVAFAIGENDQRKNRLWWRGIAGMLFLMGIDEVASIHNMPSRRLGELVGVHDGWLMNAWILPAILLCAGVACCYVRFLTRVPRCMACGFVLAAALYLTGAIGLEIMGSRVEYLAAGFDYDGRNVYSLDFELIGVAEEAFEYAGMLLTLAILIRRAKELGASATIQFAQSNAPVAEGHKSPSPLS